MECIGAAIVMQPRRRDGEYEGTVCRATRGRRSGLAPTTSLTHSFTVMPVPILGDWESTKAERKAECFLQGVATDRYGKW